MQTKENIPSMVILGGGIMGCCLALALSQRGYAVDLFDMADRPMTGASLHNEGKLHLGYVYAKDPFDKTYLSMIRGSLLFGRSIRELTGMDPASMAISSPFQYIVPRDSQMTLDAVATHFEHVDEAIRTHMADSKALYFGRKIAASRMNDPVGAEDVFPKRSIMGSFTTDEISVSPDILAEWLIAAINREKKIRFRGRTHIRSVTRLSSGMSEVEVFADGKNTRHRFDCVVNCLWGDKIRIDRTAGILSDVPVLVRYKAAIRIRTKDPRFCDLPSVTAILGSYGDLVNFGRGDFYLSWYPLCKLAEAVNGDMQDMARMLESSGIIDITNLTPYPDRYPGKQISGSLQEEFVDRSLLSMSDLVPGLKGLIGNKTSFTIGGGIILAKGNTDISDPQSQLHQRSLTGPVAYGSYITVDTGKYCLAPMHALDAAKMISAIL
jgi:glycine/D-amino acid oxidase-like deaminating enzyme